MRALDFFFTPVTLANTVQGGRISSGSHPALFAKVPLGSTFLIITLTEGIGEYMFFV